jgi:DNA-binding MarR family transcriptional regulator
MTLDDSTLEIELEHDTRDDTVRSMARDCLLTRTRQISRVVTAIYDDALRTLNINGTQFALLVMISELGPLSRSDLGRKNHHDRSTLSRNLQPLISRGWVSEIAAVKDRRRRLLCVTCEGHTLLRDAAPAWSIAQDKARIVLGKRGASEIITIAAELPHRMV